MRYGMCNAGNVVCVGVCSFTVCGICRSACLTHNTYTHTHLEGGDESVSKVQGLQCHQRVNPLQPLYSIALQAQRAQRGGDRSHSCHTSQAVARQILREWWSTTWSTTTWSTRMWSTTRSTTTWSTTMWSTTRMEEPITIPHQESEACAVLQMFHPHDGIVSKQQRFQLGQQLQ